MRCQFSVPGISRRNLKQKPGGDHDLLNRDVTRPFNHCRVRGAKRDFLLSLHSPHAHLTNYSSSTRPTLYRSCIILGHFPSTSHPHCKCHILYEKVQPKFVETSQPCERHICGRPPFGVIQSFPHSSAASSTSSSLSRNHGMDGGKVAR